METILFNPFNLTPEQLEERAERMKISRLRYLDEQIEIEVLKLSMARTEAKKHDVLTRIAVLELRKEQVLR